MTLQFRLTPFLVKEGYFLSFLGSMVAGFITTCASLPVDIAKTRTQNMKVIHKYDSYFISEIINISDNRWQARIYWNVRCSNQDK